MKFIYWIIFFERIYLLNY